MKHKIVKSRWEVSALTFSFNCPFCSKYIEQYDFKYIFNDGEEINKIVSCPKCKEKFRLKIDNSYF
jgi:transcription elongation factor Elf1